MRGVWFIFALLVHAPAQAANEDYAAWKAVNTDGSWTRAAEAGVAATELATRVPTDIDLFCPGYATATAEDRQRFWVALLSAMARPESNFKPGATYLEPDITDAAGKNVTSRGLLQISKESANAKAYGCGIQDALELHDPAVNLSCGARIMSHWVAKDGRIAAQTKPARGGARYWSVLRAWRGHLPEISGFTRSLPLCKKP